MTDEELIGYVLNLLEPSERRAVERYVTADPASSARVQRVCAAVAPLAVDREPPLPPDGLAVRTLARLAEHIVAETPRPPARPADFSSRPTIPELTPVEPSSLTGLRGPAERPNTRAIGRWLRPDVFVAASIGLLLVGLVLSGIGRARYEYGTTLCQNNLRKLYQGLVDYSDSHEKKFPQVGDQAHPTAGTFTAALAQDGDLPNRFGFTWHCPGSHRPDTVLSDAESQGWNDAVPERVQYTYALGYRGPNGELLGLRRNDLTDEEADNMPIVADYPASGVSPGPGPVSPHLRGHNVLYVGGNVRYATTATVGVGGDDIFRNQEGKVAAGLNRADAALGRPSDRP